jgi:hypothetical protein
LCCISLLENHFNLFLDNFAALDRSANVWYLAPFLINGSCFLNGFDAANFRSVSNVSCDPKIDHLLSIFFDPKTSTIAFLAVLTSNQTVVGSLSGTTGKIHKMNPLNPPMIYPAAQFYDSEFSLSTRSILTKVDVLQQRVSQVYGVLIKIDSGQLTYFYNESVHGIDLSLFQVLN